jgi:hypothetical protein
LVLTIQVLARNNAETIGRCLESAVRVGGRVVVGDLGSSDGTPRIARDMGVEVVDLKFDGDYSEVRNSLCSKGLNMYVEPWETVARGAEAIGGLSGGHYFYVMNGGVVSKEVRLWERGRFENPVFETVVGAEAVVTPGVVIVGGQRPDSRAENTSLSRKWVERSPTSPDPYYYLACSLLAEGRTKEFLATANKYLLMSESGGEATVLMNYYLARVQFVQGEIRDAYRRALGCLATCPSFAEFWCLVGDMLYSRGDHARASHMYQNARMAGMRRPSDDTFPVELSKYDSYPKTMEEKCSKAAGGGVVVGSKTT